MKCLGADFDEKGANDDARRLIGPHPENALCRLVLSHHHGFPLALHRIEI